MVVGGIEQAFQARWIGGAVIVQQPHPRDHIGRQRGFDRGHGGQPGIHCSAETIIGIAKDYALFAERFGQHRSAGIVGGVVDADHGIGLSRLLGQGCQHRRQPHGSVVGDDHRGHVVAAARQEGGVVVGVEERVRLELEFSDRIRGAIGEPGAVVGDFRAAGGSGLGHRVRVRPLSRGQWDERGIQ